MAVSGSVTVKLVPTATAALVVWSGICEKLGGSSTATTANTKSSESVLPKVSETVTRIVFVPNALRLGWMVKVLVAPVPLMTMLVSETKV